ncbi:MAG: hypothetical protein R8G34_16030 [Paracoccaceae bacterium]|nr:hypothetical protein [Paracoccaceae bacterium]
MDEPVEIMDDKCAKAWLETQDHQTQVWFATRCALRALPALGSRKDATTSRLAFTTCRASLISAAAATCPAAEMMALSSPAAAAFSAATAPDTAAFSAAFSAAAAADSAAAAAFSIATAADSAFSAAFSAAAAADSAFSAAFSAATFDSVSPGNWVLLWSDIAQPEGLKAGWDALKAQWAADEADWSFWIAWYEGILNGSPMDWDMIFKIATEITDEEWDAGQTVVAERIKEIQVDFFANRLPQAETITRDLEGTYAVVASTDNSDKIIDRIFRQLDFSLNLALRSHNTSGFSDMCTAYQYLNHTRLNCRDDPNAVHMHIRLAREILESRLDTGEYQIEDSLVALVSALGRHEIQLRADHPEVRKAHETFVEQRLRELDEEKRLAIATEFKALSGHSKERLSTEFVLDAVTLESSTGVKAQADAVKRSGGRSQRISLSERAAEATKKADGSAINKGTGLLLRLDKITELLSSLF